MKRYEKVVIWGSIIILSIVVLQVLAGKGNPKTEKRIAYHYSQEFVKRKLISPASAEFPNFDNIVVAKYENIEKYFVKGYVDADNAFGAKIRKKYKCWLEKESSGNWRLINIEFY